jgi:hypothetical protein
MRKWQREKRKAATTFNAGVGGGGRGAGGVCLMMDGMEEGVSEGWQ